MQITTTTPWIAPGGGGTQQSSIQAGRLRPEVQPLTLWNTILTEKVALSSTFFWQNMVLSLSHTQFRTLYPFLTADNTL